MLTVSVVLAALSPLGDLPLDRLAIGRWLNALPAATLLASGSLFWILGLLLALVLLAAVWADRARLVRELAAERERRRAAEEQRAIADAAKIDFMATMSHEVRTPINAVLGMTELLLRDELPAAQRERLSTIDISAQAMLSLVDDLLDLSRIEAGQLRPRPGDFRLSTLVADVVRLVDPRAASKGLELSGATAPGSAEELYGDAGRLRQVLLNLVVNAIKFTTEGQVRIMAKVEGGEAGMGRLRFEVADTGIGISPRLQNRLFEPFAQADTSEAQRIGGSGLGLAISKKLIELMGGEIGVDSKIGSGSIFWFQVPIGAARAPLPAVSTDLPRFAADARVLVVEDNPINQQVIVGQLATLGLEADATDDGHGAIDALSRHRYAAVLMDVQLPGLDGYETTRRYRQLELEHGERRVIIAVTANAMEGEKARCLAAGMDDFLAKPFRLRDLADVLRRYLPVVGAASAQVPAIAPPAVSPPPPARKADAAKPVLDPEVIAELRAVGHQAQRNLLGKLAAAFGPSGRGLLQQIEAGLLTRDYDAARAAAHQFKSAAANVGALTLAAHARNLEDAARQLNLDAAHHFLQRLQDQLPTVEAALIEAAGSADEAGRQVMSPAVN
jgi:signal transduction histidine kinase/CheY-like chemotaxis protein